jgi:hypothetical protein
MEIDSKKIPVNGNENIQVWLVECPDYLEGEQHLLDDIEMSLSQNRLTATYGERLEKLMDLNRDLSSPGAASQEYRYIVKYIYEGE